MALGLIACWSFLTGCHNANEVSGPWMSFAGPYSATYSIPCGNQATVHIDVAQSGSRVTARIPGFGDIDCAAAPAGQLPRLTGCTFNVESVCGRPETYTSQTYSDDGQTIQFVQFNARGEDCGCGGTGTIATTLALKRE